LVQPSRNVAACDDEVRPKALRPVQPISQLLPRGKAPRKRAGVKKPSFGAVSTEVSAALAGVGHEGVGEGVPAESTSAKI
jgi:hypothetical protein